jgi:predicted nucleic acid-binding protein
MFNNKSLRLTTKLSAAIHPDPALGDGAGILAVEAKIRADLKQSGTPIGAYDLLIAATAITHNLKLITANPQEFERIQGLFWENWRLG